MAKEKYSRRTQRSNFLKKVIIRIDYSGLVSADSFVNDIKEWLLSGYFDSLSRRYIGQAKLNLSDIGSIAKTLMIPVQGLKNEPLYVFSGTPYRRTKDTVSMEISAYYTGIDITCCEYQTIQPYQELLNEFVTRFYEKERTLSINRLGIRKAGGVLFDDYSALARVFEPGLFLGAMPDEKMSLINREYLDCFFNEEHTMKVNYKRGVSSVLDSKRNNKIQAALDIDVYIDNEIIQSAGLNMKKDFMILFEKLNDYQFDLYRNSVTEEYLESTYYEQ